MLNALPKESSSRHVQKQPMSPDTFLSQPDASRADYKVAVCSNAYDGSQYLYRTATHSSLHRLNKLQYIFSILCYFTNPLSSGSSTTSTMTVTKPILRRVPMSAGADKVFEILQEDGVLIIEGFMTPEQVKAFNSEVDPYMKKWELGQGTMQEGYLANMKQLSSLPLFSKTFRDDLMNHPLLHEVCAKAFGPESGDYWLTTSSVLETDPGYPGQELHREHDGLPLCTTLGKQSPEAMLNFLTALTDFTDENGATRVLPGSHLWDDFSQGASTEDAVPAVMNPGDTVLFSGKTLHGAGKNQSKDFLRRGFPLIMQSCQFTPVEAAVAIPRSLVETMTPLAQKMVGWRSVSAKGVEIWTYDLKDLAKGLGLKSNQASKKGELVQ